MKPLSRILIILAVSFAVQSCDEVFPPYQEPADVLVGKMQINSADTVNMVFDNFSGSYYTNSVLALNISVKNVYDDLLQGEAEVGERVVLQSFGASPKVIVIPLTRGTLLSPPVFMGSIALPPKSEAKFSVQFLPVGSDNLPVYLGGPFTSMDSTKVYGPIEFIANAEIRLFQRVQPITIRNYKFSLWFREYTSQ
jgi:hypothetical protein